MNELDAQALESLRREMSSLKERERPEPICFRSPPSDHYLENLPKTRREKAQRRMAKAKKSGNEVLHLQQIKIESLEQRIAELRGTMHRATFVHRSGWLRNLYWECVSIYEAGSNCDCSPNMFRRKLVWERDKLEFADGREMIQCCHCSKLVSWEDFTVDHLKPKTLGGGDNPENMAASCRPCNCGRPVEDISHKFHS